MMMMMLMMTTMMMMMMTITMMMMMMIILFKQFSRPLVLSVFLYPFCFAIFSSFSFHIFNFYFRLILVWLRSFTGSACLLSCIPASDYLLSILSFVFNVFIFSPSPFYLLFFLLFPRFSLPDIFFSSFPFNSPPPPVFPLSFWFAVCLLGLGLIRCF